MTQLVTMFDTIGDDYTNIPLNAAKIGGYVTGTGGVLWAAHAWARFPRSGHVRTDQTPSGSAYAMRRDPGNGHPSVLADVYDMEDWAGTPTRFAQMVPDRHDAGLPNAGYGTESTMVTAARLLDQVPGRAAGWWHGHVDWWLADPNLDEHEAAALVGTIMHGFVIRSVQWATPTTNPGTPVPDGAPGATLKSANLDLSVADAAWFPAPKPPPAAWQAQALQLARELEQHAQALAAFLGAHQ